MVTYLVIIAFMVGAAIYCLIKQVNISFSIQELYAHLHYGM